ncbi:hypothetical protein QAD02_011991 [Eretmocerus hayati]|uniref:Uncharacterized protein n=1 Tax=Eretmocerus hayati TaxID=131215 RepID=A0ACC2NYD4_9HYME|nr:hypothetical protein QAD02_011991 [Eretmocerus hayati]
MIDSKRIDGCNSQDFDLLRQGRVPRSHDELETYRRLVLAIRGGQKDLARIMIEEGAPVNENRFTFGHCRVSPLHRAVQLGCPDLIRLLLDYGACVNIHYFVPESPLMLSVKLRRFFITDLLLSADHLKNSDKSNSFYLSHFHIACLRGHICAARKLIEQGANVNEVVKEGSFYYSGYTPLHFAVDCQSPELVQLLIDCGASLKMKDARSYTALHLAHEVRNETIIDILLAAHMYEFGNPVDSGGFSHFHVACTRNHVSFVKYFLSQGCDVNMPCNTSMIGGNEDSYLPLEFAVEYECPDVVELLLFHGAKVMDSMEYGSIFTDAYFIGNKRIIDLLLSNKEKKGESRFIIQKMSDLCRACMGFDQEKIKQSLMRHEGNLVADLNTSFWNDFTPLHVLVMCPNIIELLTLLRVSGASSQLNVTMRDAKMRTPLHIAFESITRNDLESVIDELVNLDENPADFHGLTHFHIVCTTNRVDLIERYLDNDGNVEHFVGNDSIRWSGYGPLHFATKFKQLEVVQMLLKHGTRIFAEHENTLTPLDLAILNLNTGPAAIFEYKDEEVKILEKILSEAERSRSLNSSNSRGFSLLHVTCKSLALTRSDRAQPNYELLEQYIATHPEIINQKIDYVDSELDGKAPIHLAMRLSDIDVDLVKWLIKKGADIHIKDSNGFTPLQTDIDGRGKFRILASNPGILCVPGNPVDIRGQSYFHIGCILGDIETIKFYLRSGIDINLQTKLNIHGYYESKTPLHLAIANNSTKSIKIVSFLLSKGADPVARDATLNTPLHYACHPKTINMLISHGADVNSINVYGQTALQQMCSSPMDLEITKRTIITLLDNGADINIQDDMGKTPFTEYFLFADDEDGLQECLAILLKHAKKLEVLGRYISDVNKEARIKLINNSDVPEYHEQEFIDQCLTEIARMKSTRVDHYTSLYSILSKNPTQMASFCKNPTFLDSIQSNKFGRNFPNYGYLLKIQYKIGMMKRPRLKRCKILLSYSSGLSFELSEKILEHLDNTDLDNIIKSVESP